MNVVYLYWWLVNKILFNSIQGNFKSFSFYFVDTLPHWPQLHPPTCSLSSLTVFKGLKGILFVDTEASLCTQGQLA